MKFSEMLEIIECFKKDVLHKNPNEEWVFKGIFKKNAVPCLLFESSSRIVSAFMENGAVSLEEFSLEALGFEDGYFEEER